MTYMTQNQDKKVGTKSKAWNHVFSRYLRCVAKVQKLEKQVAGKEPLDIFISKDLHKTMLKSQRSNLKMYDYMLKLIDLDQ